jgi:hypothetical protein
MAPPVHDDRLPLLQEELSELERDFRQKYEEINAVQSYYQDAEGYSSEADEQFMRLESINLFDSKDGFSVLWCPLCSSTLPNPITTVSAMNEVMKKLDDELRVVKREKPILSEQIKRLKNELEQIRRLISEKRAVIKSIIDESSKQQSVIQTILEKNNHNSRVVGRIEYYLEIMKPIDSDSLLQKEVEEAKKLVEYYEKGIDNERIEDIETLILNLLRDEMTEWARELELEYSGVPYRFDRNKLTVVAEVPPNKPISMAQMRGRSNWLGCHLITHLALHKHFIEQNHPVPSFLILDQPTQGFFPSQKAYNNMREQQEKGNDYGTDILAVRRMFNFLFKICEELSPNFQIIIMEHANLDDNNLEVDQIFQNSLIETRWTGKGNKALIPENWVSDPPTFHQSRLI